MFKHLDAILLFVFSFLFSQFTRDVTTMEEVLIPVVIFLDLIYFIISFVFEEKNANKRKIFIIKAGIIFLIFTISISKSMFAAINMRHLRPKTYPVHDNPVQIEQAARYLYQGKNPYSQDYRGIGMEKSWPQNPAVYHVVTMPFYLVFSAIVLYVVNLLTGYFDERIVHILIFVPVVYLMWKHSQKDNNLLLFLILFFFNPFFIHFFIGGRSDVFAYSLMFYCFFALFNKKYFLASLFFGLAFVSKQSSWLFAPLFFYYLFLQNKGKLGREKLRWVLGKTWVFFAVTAIFIAPFLIWDTPSFLDDIYRFPAGSLKTSFPIMGFGFSSILRETRFLKSDAYFPFQYLQLLLGVPTLLMCARYLKNNLRLDVLINTYAIFLFVFWFFSRFFLDNYIGFILMLFLTANLFTIMKKNENS